MADTTNKRILHIETADFTDLQNTQIGVMSGNDGDLGYQMWGGKDGSGSITRWLAKDQDIKVDDVLINTKVKGASDSDTYIEWVAGGDEIKVYAGNIYMMDIKEAATDFIEINPSNLDVDFILNGQIADMFKLDAGANTMTFTMVDNTTQAFLIKEGSNNYIDIDTNNGAESIEFNSSENDVDFIVNSSSVSNAFYVSGADGKVGINNNALSARFEIWDDTGALIELHSTVEEDSDDGRDVTLSVTGERSGGETVTQGQLTWYHNGAADDNASTFRINVGNTAGGVSSVAYFHEDTVVYPDDIRVEYGSDSDGYIEYDEDGADEHIVVFQLPTSDPGVAGQFWNLNGVVQVSDGASSST